MPDKFIRVPESTFEMIRTVAFLSHTSLKHAVKFIVEGGDENVATYLETARSGSRIINQSKGKKK